MRNKYVYTEEELRAAVASSLSVREVMRKLNIKLAGGSHTALTRKIRRLELDTTHFLGMAIRAGTTSNQRLTPEQVFVLKPDGSPRSPAVRLRRALLEVGEPYECQICHISTWLDKPLTLQVDHCNGNWLDDRRENLRFLCGNCHTQTETYGNKKR